MGLQRGTAGCDYGTGSGLSATLARSRNRRSGSEADDPLACGGCHNASRRTDHTACALSWWSGKNGRLAQSVAILGKLDDRCRSGGQDRSVTQHADLQRDRCHTEQRRLPLWQRTALHFTLYRPHSKTVRASLAVRPAARARPADAQPNGKRPERPSANCKGLDRSWTTQGSCLHRQARAPIRAGWPWHAQESTGRETITSPTSRFGPAAVFERGAV